VSAVVGESSSAGRNRLWRNGVLACLVGELLGIGTASGVWALLNAWIGEPETLGERLAFLVVLVLAGALEGLWLGLFQGRVVRDAPIVLIHPMGGPHVTSHRQARAS
jgi:hypothetical protein